MADVRTRWDPLLVLLAAAAILLPFTWARDLYDADEGRYAAVALDMVRSGDWVVPTLNGMPFMDKPPLVYHVQAVLTTAFGSGEWVARAPTLLAGCLWALWIFLLARAWSGSRRAAWLAALAAATSAAGMVGSRVGPQMDMPLAACVAGALYAAFCHLQRPRWRSALGLGLAVGLGLLVKGPLVAAVPFLVAVGWMASGVGIGRVMRTMFSPTAWLLALAIAAPWYVLVERAQPGWIAHFLGYEHWGRFSEGDHRNFHPFWFYVPIVLLYLVPWTPLAWVGASGGPGRRLLGLVTGSPWSRRPWRQVLTRRFALGRDGREVRAADLAWTWFLLAFLLYSASTRKLLNYLLPAAAPLFVLVGARLAPMLDACRRLPCLLPVGLGVGVVAMGVLVAAGAFFPLATGALPSALNLPRFAPLAPWWIGAGAVLLSGAVVAARRVSRTGARAAALVISVALFWWAVDLGLARVDEIGSSRRIAEVLAVEAQEGRIPVALRRYPQGTRFYADVYVWIAGGTPDAWRQREIVNPYARRVWDDLTKEPWAEDGAPVWEGAGGLLTDTAFEALWRGPRAVALVCRYKEIPLLGAHVLAGPLGGAGRTDLYVVTNHPPGAPAD